MSTRNNREQTPPDPSFTTPPALAAAPPHALRRRHLLSSQRAWFAAPGARTVVVNALRAFEAGTLERPQVISLYDDDDDAQSLATSLSRSLVIEDAENRASMMNVETIEISDSDDEQVVEVEEEGQRLIADKNRSPQREQIPNLSSTNNGSNVRQGVRQNNNATAQLQNRRIRRSEDNEIEDEHETENVDDDVISIHSSEDVNGQNNASTRVNVDTIEISDEESGQNLDEEGEEEKGEEEEGEDRMTEIQNTNEPAEGGLQEQWDSSDITSGNSNTTQKGDEQEEENSATDVENTEDITENSPQERQDSPGSVSQHIDKEHQEEEEVEDIQASDMQSPDHLPGPHLQGQRHSSDVSRDNTTPQRTGELEKEGEEENLPEMQNVDNLVEVSLQELPGGDESSNENDKTVPQRPSEYNEEEGNEVVEAVAEAEEEEEGEEEEDDDGEGIINIYSSDDGQQSDASSEPSSHCTDIGDVTDDDTPPRPRLSGNVQARSMSASARRRARRMSSPTYSGMETHSVSEYESDDDKDDEGDGSNNKDEDDDKQSVKTSHEDAENDCSEHVDSDGDSQNESMGAADTENGKHRIERRNEDDNRTTTKSAINDDDGDGANPGDHALELAEVPNKEISVVQNTRADGPDHTSKRGPELSPSVESVPAQQSYADQMEDLMRRIPSMMSTDAPVTSSKSRLSDTTHRKSSESKTDQISDPEKTTDHAHEPPAIMRTSTSRSPGHNLTPSVTRGPITSKAHTDSATRTPTSAKTSTAANTSNAIMTFADRIAATKGKAVVTPSPSQSTSMPVPVLTSPLRTPRRVTPRDAVSTPASVPRGIDSDLSSSSSSDGDGTTGARSYSDSDNDSDESGSRVRVRGTPRVRTPRSMQRVVRNVSDCELRGLYTWMGFAVTQGRSFSQARENIAKELMAFFDVEVLGKQLGGRVTVAWNVRLCKTAGMTYLKLRSDTRERIAKIELSVKVLDDVGRLYNTLAHELCHAAAWIIDNVAKPPHGTTFKKWAGLFNKWDSKLEITTCHEYEIRFKFNYVCTKEGCDIKYGRHSRSINVEKQVCGKCRSKLKLVVHSNRR